MKKVDLSFQRFIFPNINNEGWKFVSIFAAITALLAIFWLPLGVIGLVLTILGGVGAFVMVIVYTMLTKEYKIVDVLLYGFAIMLGIGSAYLFIVKKANKTIIGKKIVINYDFEETFMTAVFFSNGEQTSVGKIYYKDIVKVKYTQKYIFLFNNPSNAFPILKSTLELEELKTLTDWVNKAREKKN